FGTGAAYDSDHGSLLVFGGTGDSAGNTANDEVWALSLNSTAAWNQLSTSGDLPPARFNAAAVYDDASQRLVVFGGANASGRLGDVWTLSLSGAPVWSQLTPRGTAPSPR